MTAIDWNALDDGKFADEDTVLARLLDRHGLGPADRAAIGRDAEALVIDIRTSRRRHGVAESFINEFGLSTREGVALMCLAEALLRTSNPETRDDLIAEKIAMADWQSHAGQSDNWYVNAATWGLILTGRLVEADAEARRDLPSFFKRLTMRVGEPVIRSAVAAAVRIMGEQFVLGRTIEDALARAAREELLCSFDMLGEGARTADDAAGYADIYARAIERVGLAARGRGPEAGHGVSVKLSALCPRFEATQEARVWTELYPRLRDLAMIAARHDLNLSIDAEEADRLVLSLKLIDRLAHEEALGDWQGLGVVVQAYQKRAPEVIAALADLARRSGRRIMIRLVKGAYWDSEIKRAQVAGYTDYTVYTSKAATDLSYIACARALLDSAPLLYPQFATHNAHTLATVRTMAEKAGVAVECQRLHGMGEGLYEAAAARFGELRVRTYAPVGGHEALLPYLVRRLLENGANSSFVHLLMDDSVPVQQLVRDPIAVIEAAPHRNPRLPLPAAIYGPARANSQGRDLSQQAVRQVAARQIAALKDSVLAAKPIIGGIQYEGDARSVLAPADTNHVVGTVALARPAHIDAAVERARVAQPGWNALGGHGRAGILGSMADALAHANDRLVALLTLEAGKTFNDAVAEAREATDFCRYYAMLAEEQFGAPRPMPGPVGERNHWRLSGRGLFACISPWNFPLAIFTGQIAAALAAGNAVIAKPAESTPLIAQAAVQIFHDAGLNPDLLALLPGEGETIGAALVGHPGVDGIAFTGGTETAAAINRALAARPGPIIPFIAETGGLNAMVIDTTALREQVIDDVMLSAFGSAGQRCSALRMLFVPEESADALIASLAGALDALVVGDPGDPATDVGPVIDADAKAALAAHVARLDREARIIARGRITAQTPGHYFAPVIAQVPTPDFLEREVFGPILHIYRYGRGELEPACARLAARGYGLTLGIHSRIDQFAARIQALIPAGNVYINRSMIGAVVGVQPFGGIGLSGTGPKAGGPHALLRFASEQSVSNNIMAQGGDPSLFDV